MYRGEVFDLNVHFTGRVERLCSVSVEEARQGFHDFINRKPASVRGANFMLFNSDLIYEDAWADLMEEIRGSLPLTAFTLLLNFRDDVKRSLTWAKDLDFWAVKFHAIQQRIEREEYPDVLRSARMAEELGFAILVDASYGTLSIYRYSGLELAVFLAEEIKTVPIVILHNGGYRALEALLIAMSAENIYIELSFSLPFYRGSSVEKDIAFICRKIGHRRAVYASDHPFVPVDESLSTFMDFARQEGLDQQLIRKICWENAVSLVFG